MINLVHASTSSENLLDRKFSQTSYSFHVHRCSNVATGRTDFSFPQFTSVRCTLRSL